MSRVCLGAVLVCLALTTAAWTAAPPRARNTPQPAEDPALRLAIQIDRHIDAELARRDVAPAPVCDDSTFLRRASLDLTGRIPTVTRARRFLADDSPDRREAEVRRLLDEPGYATHLAAQWRDLLVPNSFAEFQRRYLGGAIERWLIRHFRQNTPYDRMTRELLTYSFPRVPRRDIFGQLYGREGPTPLAFYLEKEGKAEEMASGFARVFLGVRLECAQCHDHPSGTWSREQFWQQTAFFASLRAERAEFFSPITDTPDRREVNIPNTDRVAQARFLDGTEPRWKFKTSARETLADWLTAKDNRYFARAAVNRVWEHLMGVGLVDPVDDFRADNPPSHPGLLDELARAFVAQGYDLKFLHRAIVLSRAYQRSSRMAGPAPDIRLFARMPLRGLTPEQLVDSLEQATGVRDNTERTRRQFVFNSPRQKLIEKFLTTERRIEVQTSIPQALTLMNNEWVARATSLDRGPVLAGVLAAPFLDDAGRIETLFLATLARRPTPEEAARLGQYVARGGASGDRRKALRDVLWALINSTEFVLNH